MSDKIRGFPYFEEEQTKGIKRLAFVCGISWHVMITEMCFVAVNNQHFYKYIQDKFSVVPEDRITYTPSPTPSDDRNIQTNTNV